MERIRVVLIEAAAFLEAEGTYSCSVPIRDALAGDDKNLEAFLVSNELWGGSGSIPDRCLPDNQATRRVFQALFIRLGTLQMEAGLVNPKTKDWVRAFKTVAVQDA